MMEGDVQHNFDGYPPLNTHSDITLEQPDIQQMRKDRYARNRQVMNNVDPGIANKVFPEDAPVMSKLDKCAVCIQRHYRGYLGRKKYVELLYEQFTQEEKLQHNKVLEQLEEGELLVENHKLEVLFDDNLTTRRNKTRKYLSNIITIQRAWRQYVKKQSSDEEAKQSSKDFTSEIDDTSKDLDTEKEVMTLSGDYHERLTPSSENIPTNIDSEINNETYKDKYVNNNNSIDNTEGSVQIILPDNLNNYTEKSSKESTPEDSISSELRDSTPEDDRIYTGFISPGHRTLNKIKHERDIDSESLSSDYSEVSVPLRDFTESEVQIVQKTDLTHGNFLPSLCIPSKDSLEKQPNETEEDFSRRVRKVNLLSIAQEFAELKKVNADALPFDLHKSQGDSNTESSSSEASSKPPSEMTTPSDPTIAFTQPGQKGNSNSSSDLNCNSTTTRSNINDAPYSNQSSGISNRSDKSNLNGNTQNEDKHRRGQSSDRNKRERSLERGEEGDFDVYNIETTLPQMDWDSLEQQLHQATQVQQQRQEAQRNDREEIRRKLAMGIGMEEEFNNADKSYKKTNITSRHLGGKNLQVCFMNENQDNDNQEVSSTTTSTTSSNTSAESDKKTNLELKLSPIKQRTGSRTEEQQKEDEDFFKTQAQLQHEAKIALAQASSMAHMQLEIEKQMIKKSPIAEIVGLPYLGDFRIQKLGRDFLLDMNIAQLQVVVNDLHTQIENLNEELVKMLMERDDLHMSQDSMLVDIEDLTRRAEQNASKVNHKSKKESRR